MSDKGIENLKKELPDLVVYKSQRRGIAALTQFGEFVEVGAKGVRWFLGEPDLKSVSGQTVIWWYIDVALCFPLIEEPLRSR